MSVATQRVSGRAELGFAAFLGVAGAVVIIDASRLHVTYSQADPVGPKALPFVVGALLLLCAVLLAINVARGGAAEPEEGEDVDPNSPIGWRVVLPLVGVFIFNIAFINILGWVISGTILFWGSVWALGSRRYLRDGLISLAMALLSFYGFYLGLGIHLPAGILKGVL